MRIRGLHERRPLFAVGVFFLVALFLNLVAREFFIGLGEGGGWERVFSNPLSSLNKFTPTIAGIFCIWLFAGGGGLKRLAGRLFDFGQRRFGLLAAIIYPLAALIIALLLYAWISGEGLAFSSSTLNLALIGAALYQISLRTLAGGGLGEEIGWRGFAMPVLMSRYGPLVSTLIIGFLWSAWHWPGIIAGGDPWIGEVIEHLYLTTLITFVFTYFYLKTDGSLSVAVLLHGCLNGFFTFGARDLAPAFGLSNNWQPYFDWVFIAGGLILMATLYIRGRTDRSHASKL